MSTVARKNGNGVFYVVSSVGVTVLSARLSYSMQGGWDIVILNRRR